MHLLALWLKAIWTLSPLPPVLRGPAYAALGLAGGMGLLLLRVSEFPSYLSDSPRTCINCHVMNPEYISWQRSSHRAAVCNDCHVPHDSLARKYAFKAQDGLRHATIFALRREPQVIEARPASRAVIEANCRRCHARLLRAVPTLGAGGRSCVDCHRSVPHGDVHGLATTPGLAVPHLPPLTAAPGGQP